MIIFIPGNDLKLKVPNSIVHCVQNVLGSDESNALKSK